MLRAMLWGDRNFVNTELAETFQKTAAFHVLVAAGLHVGALAIFVFWLCRLLRLPIAATTVITLVVLVRYLGIGQDRPPILRAALGCYGLDRRTHTPGAGICRRRWTLGLECRGAWGNAVYEFKFSGFSISIPSLLFRYSVMIRRASSAWDCKTITSEPCDPSTGSPMGNGSVVEEEPGAEIPALSSRPRITIASVAEPAE
ncbi:MAG TPA: ComEC/Rec2 family competence protein [Candidatus Acidoferrales bacterium]|nr:ComEC/Rec2 family competence protein [Candidatus Acidoferrales bacterium]